jgi:hypothetical protein
MESRWAREFREIPEVLAVRPDLRARMVALTALHMPNKSTEGPGRLDAFRAILVELIEGRLAFEAAVAETARRLPPAASAHRADRRVFASGWNQRITHTHFSRLYNQAVLELLAAEGHTQCFVPHSSHEGPDSTCARDLAGRRHEIVALYVGLVETYLKKRPVAGPKVPNHPHCTHVVVPLDAAT